MAAPSSGRDPLPRPDREIFEVRLNTIDYYMSKPFPGLDATESPFRGNKPVEQARVPLLAPN